MARHEFVIVSEDTISIYMWFWSNDKLDLRDYKTFFILN